MMAEKRREEARVHKQIEVAHKEMERLEKYVNITKSADWFYTGLSNEKIH